MEGWGGGEVELAREDEDVDKPMEVREGSEDDLAGEDNAQYEYNTVAKGVKIKRKKQFFTVYYCTGLPLKRQK
ncbi:hypothetical protein TIFTF001_003113 [Ficus carica]|uniref:Uncharacterized protein n=1 Tax=Ficus carica TaxID=3494 RepID=A0AA87ZG32_FICCA|nr:hypothetical protein TIFTF001_003113 [Ficus carica]